MWKEQDIKPVPFAQVWYFVHSAGLYHLQTVKIFSSGFSLFAELMILFIPIIIIWIKQGAVRIYLMSEATLLYPKLPPEFFCQTSFWQNDLVLLVDIES